MPLGLFAEPALERGSIALSPSAGLLLYTDGVTEAQNADDELFGDERLELALADAAGLAPDALCDRICAAVAAHQGAAAQADDLTMVALRMGLVRDEQPIRLMGLSRKR
jgi:sigma-B regulation protein RsbU (phosphoserine phosphatase)